MAQRMFSMTIDNSISLMEKIFKNFERVESSDQDRFVSILISKPGVGKSATVAKMCERMGYDLIDLNLSCLEPTDLIGLGAREKVNGQWQTLPALPTWAERALQGNCVIFVDEFNNTTQDVLSGFQKMFSDFVIDGRPLPRTTHIIGACNPPGKDAIYAAKKLSGAFRRRLCMIPVVDDFKYVENKHDFVMPKNFADTNYDDMMNYCSYDGISSAIVDNVFNIHKYGNLSDLEKITLVNGFGEKAFDFAMEQDMFSSDIISSGKRVVDDSVTYGIWIKNPDDRVGEWQQILWGQEKLQRSTSYSRSKTFVSKVTNPRVYVALNDVLKNRFEMDWEIDDARLPESRLESNEEGHA